MYISHTYTTFYMSCYILYMYKVFFARVQGCCNTRCATISCQPLLHCCLEHTWHTWYAVFAQCGVIAQCGIHNGTSNLGRGEFGNNLDAALLSQLLNPLCVDCGAHKVLGDLLGGLRLGHWQWLVAAMNQSCDDSSRNCYGRVCVCVFVLMCVYLSKEAYI